MYSGDVYDSPPLVLRIALGAVCLIGAIIILVNQAALGRIPAVIIIVGGLGIAEYLIFTTPTVAGVTYSTVAFGAVIAACAFTTPI